MHATKYIMWEEEGRWHGHLKDHPDILAQAESFEDLQIKLSSLYRDLTAGNDLHSQPPPSHKPYPMPPHIATDKRLQQLLSSMLNEP
jgi:predicted RNase H-like HicB family nuclease